MPKKLGSDLTVPTLILERLATWGRCIHVQRVRQRLTAAALAERMQISRATLARLERGDPGVSISAYLNALLILGVFDDAAPPLPASLWSDGPQQRVRPTRGELGGGEDADYF